MNFRQFEICDFKILNFFHLCLLDALRHDGALQDGEFFIEAFGCACAAAEFVKFCPEGGTVVEFFEVAEFVANDIVDEVGGQEQEPQREVDIAQRRAASPTGGDVLYGEAVELQVVLRGDVAQSLGENDLCVVAHGGCHDFVCPLHACLSLKLKAARHIDGGTFRRALDGGVWFGAGFKAELENVGRDMVVVA